MVAQITLTLSWQAIAAFVGFFGLIISAINLLIKVNRNHRLLMDSKVDIDEFKEHCRKNENEFKAITEKQINVQIDTNQILATMSTNIGILATDVSWLKDKEIRSGNNKTLKK
jgi:hypothetical protein